jgi:hypothetical protein
MDKSSLDKRIRDAIDEFLEGSFLNPLHDREVIFIEDEKPTVGLTIQPYQGRVYLKHIRTFDPGKGHASRILDRLTSIAKKHQVPVALYPQPTKKQGLSKKKLLSWYQRHGFKPDPDAPGILLYSP